MAPHFIPGLCFRDFPTPGTYVITLRSLAIDLNSNVKNVTRFAGKTGMVSDLFQALHKMQVKQEWFQTCFRDCARCK